MKLGLCEICYIKPVSQQVATVVSNIDNATKLTFGTPLSLFMWKLYKIGFTIAMCITALKLIQLVICLVRKDSDLDVRIDELKRSVLGTVLMALVPRADEMVDFLLNIIF